MAQVTCRSEKSLHGPRAWSPSLGSSEVSSMVAASLRRACLSCGSSTGVLLGVKLLNDNHWDPGLVLVASPYTPSLGCESRSCSYRALTLSLICSCEMAELIFTSCPGSPDSLWAGAIFQSSASYKHKSLFRGAVTSCQDKLRARILEKENSDLPMTNRTGSRGRK